MVVPAQPGWIISAPSKISALFHSSDGAAHSAVANCLEDGFTHSMSAGSRHWGNTSVAVTQCKRKEAAKEEKAKGDIAWIPKLV